VGVGARRGRGGKAVSRQAPTRPAEVLLFVSYSHKAVFRKTTASSSKMVLSMSPKNNVFHTDLPAIGIPNINPHIVTLP
jgi:hypothetical protein